MNEQIIRFIKRNKNLINMCKSLSIPVFLCLCFSVQAIHFELFLSPNQRTFLEFNQAPVQSGCDSVMTLFVVANSSVHFRCPTENVNQWVSNSLIMYTHDVGCYLDTNANQMVVIDWGVDPGNCILACGSNSDCVSWAILGLILSGLVVCAIFCAMCDCLAQRCRQREGGPRYFDSHGVNYASTGTHLSYQPVTEPVSNPV